MRYGDLREQVFVPASRIRRQQFVLGVDADLPGLPGERHAGLLRGPVALVVIAGKTAGHQVLPGRRPTSRSRNHVIEREVARGQPGAAVLAGAPIPKQDPLSGNRPVLPRHPPIFHQAHHAMYISRPQTWLGEEDSNLHMGLLRD